MYTDPQSVTLDGAKSLPRINTGDGNSTYRTADEKLQLRISHKPNKGRVRSMARLDETVIAADPLTAEQGYQTAGAYIVIDKPKVGFTVAQLTALAVALSTWLTADSNANLVKLLGAEH